MRRRYPEIHVERYADDVIVHCKTEVDAKDLRNGDWREVRAVQAGASTRWKTKVIYCKDDERRGTYSHEKFDFLGFTFRPRLIKSRWGKCLLVLIRRSVAKQPNRYREPLGAGELHRRSDKSLGDLAQMYNPSSGDGSTTMAATTNPRFTGYSTNFPAL